VGIKKSKIYNRLIAYGILQKIVLLAAKFVLLLTVRRLVLIWTNKKLSEEDKSSQQALSFFRLGIKHISSLLISSRKE
jgi:hypothetical protein